MKPLIFALLPCLLLALRAEAVTPGARPPTTATPAQKDAANSYIHYGLLAEQSHETQKAINYFSGGIRANPSDWRTYEYRAEEYLESKEWAKAVQDCSTVMRFQPNRVRPYTVRAYAYYFMGRDKDSLADVATVIKTRPNEMLLDPVIILRKALYVAPLEFSLEAVRQAREKANRDVDHARGDKGKADALNSRAWLFSTSPLKELRDGDQAMKDAMDGCSLTKWKDSSMIDTLAAAYAEKGDYAKAIATEKQALSRAEKKPKLLLQEHRHLTEYEHHRPYRMSAADREPPSET